VREGEEAFANVWLQRAGTAGGLLPARGVALADSIQPTTQRMGIATSSAGRDSGSADAFS
jgi:hypothetical protein